MGQMNNEPDKNECTSNLVDSQNERKVNDKMDRLIFEKVMPWVIAYDEVAHLEYMGYERETQKKVKEEMGDDYSPAKFLDYMWQFTNVYDTYTGEEVRGVFDTVWDDWPLQFTPTTDANHALRAFDAAGLDMLHYDEDEDRWIAWPSGEVKYTYHDGHKDRLVAICLSCLLAAEYGFLRPREVKK